MLDDAMKISTVNIKLNNKVRNHFKDNFSEVRKILTPYGELGEIMYHIFDSVDYWLDKMFDEESKLKKYGELKTKEDFFKEWERVDNRLIRYLETNDNNTKQNLERTIHVNFTPDVEFDTTVEDLFMHISHHSMYHRSTLGALIRINNFPPLPNSTWSFTK